MSRALIKGVNMFKNRMSKLMPLVFAVSFFSMESQSHAQGGHLDKGSLVEQLLITQSHYISSFEMELRGVKARDEIARTRLDKYKSIKQNLSSLSTNSNNCSISKPKVDGDSSAMDGVLVSPSESQLSLQNALKINDELIGEIESTKVDYEVKVQWVNDNLKKATADFCKTVKTYKKNISESDAFKLASFGVDIHICDQARLE
jgi:hypothetical protein